MPKGHFNLVFWMKVEVLEGAMGPAPDALGTSLSSSTAEGETEWVPFASFMPDVDLFDGEWHKVVIPLSALWDSEKGKAFDKKKAWGWNIGEWSGEPQNYTIYFDEIGFE